MKTPRFSRKTLEFIQLASRQKKPDWLDRHREEYEEHLLLPLQDLARTAKARLSDVAPSYHFPIKGIGRLKRSAIRSQEYGALYKDWVSWSASRPAASRFDHNPNLFFLIQPGDEEGDEFLIAGGLYMPSSRQLRSIREAIAEDAGAFDRLFTSKAFSKVFPGGFCREKTATRPPRGFDPQHPRMDWLKLQGYFVWKSYRPKEYSSPEFAEQVAKDFRQIVRLNDLLESVIHGDKPRAEPQAPGRNLLGRLDEVEAPRRKMDF